MVRPLVHRSRRSRRLVGAAIAATVIATLLPAAPVAVGLTPTRTAVVGLGGSLVRGDGVASVTFNGPGSVDVEFTSGVSGCAYLVTSVNKYSQALIAYARRAPGTTDTVNIESKNQGGGLTDGAFHLVVACHGSGQRFAVVDETGALSRATAGTTIGSPGVGRYRVRFPSSVAGCAFIASVADEATDVVFNPANVSTGLGPNDSTVYVETKNPGGGLSAGIPFHLGVLCTAADTRVATVKASGLPSRASALTSSFRADPGIYRIVSDALLGAECTTVATRGSTTTNVPFDPATVEIVAGPAPNTVGIEVRELLFFTGGLTNLSFHAASVC